MDNATAPVSEKFVWPAWQKDLIAITILYRMQECGEEFPLVNAGTDQECIEPMLEEMFSKGLIAFGSKTEPSNYVATQKGKDVLKKVVQMWDQALQFEIFGAFDLTAVLGDLAQTDAPQLVCDNFYDLRFAPPGKTGPQYTDLRLAMMSFLAENGPEDQKRNALDLRRVVFIQKLNDGYLRRNDNAHRFWLDLRLGNFFRDIEAIVSSAYKWTDIADPGETAEAKLRMETLYRAGMLEDRKRDGTECSKCHIPLAIFELRAKEDGEPPLTKCPDPECNTRFTKPPTAGAKFLCPKCNGDVYASQRKCRGCGARLDFSLPPGTERTTTTAHTSVVYEPVWGYYYSIVPYGYYSPWDPYCDALAFACLMDVLW